MKDKDKWLIERHWLRIRRVSGRRYAVKGEITGNNYYTGSYFYCKNYIDENYRQDAAIERKEMANAL